jgi:hypothetical protein
LDIDDGIAAVHIRRCAESRRWCRTLRSRMAWNEDANGAADKLCRLGKQRC